MLLPSPTDRLILRCWQDEDFPAFARMNADSRVMEYFPAPLSLPESAAFFDRIRREFETERFGLYALERRTDGELLGYTGLHRVTFDGPLYGRVEIGWRLRSDMWGNGVCHGSGPKLSSLRQPVENGIHYLFHRLEQSALTTGHATARYDTITGIRPPRTTNGTSSATARPVHDPDERIRRDRTGNPAGKPSIKPTTPSNLRAAAGKISRQRLALQYPKTLDQDRSTAQGTFRIFQQLSSPNIPSVKIANGSLSRPPGPNYEPEPYRKFDRANSPSYPNLVLPPKNRPGRSSDLMANQTVRSCKKKAVEKSTAFYIGMNRPLIRQEQRPAQAADRKPEVPPAEPQERDLRRSSSPSAHWHLSRVPRCCEPPDRDP